MKKRNTRPTAAREADRERILRVLQEAGRPLKRGEVRELAPGHTYPGMISCDLDAVGVKVARRPNRWAPKPELDPKPMKRREAKSYLDIAKGPLEELRAEAKNLSGSAPLYEDEDEALAAISDITGALASLSQEARTKVLDVLAALA